MTRGIDMLRTLKEQIEPGHAALVIVDVQNETTHREGLKSKVWGKGNLWQTYPLVPRMLQNLKPLLQAARQAGGVRFHVKTTDEVIQELKARAAKPVA
ncbi:MAG: hypothetical protein HY669_00080 [Chloroflexi bacterium]|nr:hypothetical protein [Chloroflexota bacterium]